jgi:hypothetical protein
MEASILVLRGKRANQERALPENNLPLMNDQISLEVLEK